jgi:GntR family transcriptional regulator / MocR family aminotransferase
MSLQRRLALLAWTNQAGAFVLEDDYESEYRYVGRPLPALQGLDEAGRVIYIGSFTGVPLRDGLVTDSVLPAAAYGRSRQRGPARQEPRSGTRGKL